MTTALTNNTQGYWRALRFYSRSWRERYGAEMVAMMMEAADDGEDPLAKNSRRSLMWSGLRQRFASRPFAAWWLMMTLLSLGIFEWNAFRMVQAAIYADTRGTSGAVGLWLWPIAIGAALLSIASVTTFTVSALHIPPLPRHPVKPAPRGWTAWLALGGSFIVPVGGPLLAVGSLVAGIRLYRRTRKESYRALAGLSCGSLAVTALFLLPQVAIVILDR